MEGGNGSNPNTSLIGASDIQESPAHDLDCGASQTVFSVAISVSCRGPAIVQYLDNGNSLTAPSLSAPLNSLFTMGPAFSGMPVFNPPNQNSCIISNFADSSVQAAPGDFGLNEGGSYFLFGSGFQNNYWSVEINATLNPSYVAPIETFSGGAEVVPNLYFHASDGLGFVAGGPVRAIFSGNVPPGTYQVNIGMGMNGTTNPVNGVPQSGPYISTTTGIIMVGSQPICHITTQGVIELPAQGGVNAQGQPYDFQGTYQVVIQQSGLLIISLDQLNYLYSGVGGINFSLTYLHA